MTSEDGKYPDLYDTIHFIEYVVSNYGDYRVHSLISICLDSSQEGIVFAAISVIPNLCKNSNLAICQYIPKLIQLSKIKYWQNVPRAASALLDLVDWSNIRVEAVSISKATLNKDSE